MMEKSVSSGVVQGMHNRLGGADARANVSILFHKNGDTLTSECTDRTQHEAMAIVSDTMWVIPHTVPEKIKSQLAGP